MNKYKLKYWYSAQGMEGAVDEYPEKIIEAIDETEAYYKYHRSNGLFKDMSLEEFENYPHKDWATSLKKIN